MMSIKYMLICFTAYLIIISSISYLSYEQGVYDGMKKMCPTGALYEGMSGEIECLIDYEEPKRGIYPIYAGGLQ